MCVFCCIVFVLCLFGKFDSELIPEMYMYILLYNACLLDKANQDRRILNVLSCIGTDPWHVISVILYNVHSKIQPCLFGVFDLWLVLETIMFLYYSKVTGNADGYL